MSADNWRTCPACVEIAEKKRNERIKNANAKYGKVPIDEFMLMIFEAEKPLRHEPTLREDYEQGIQDDGNYYVSFHATCNQCEFQFSYENKMPTIASNEGSKIEVESE